ASPVGDWTYVYSADEDRSSPRHTAAPALDGTWDHENSSDEWDGDRPATGFNQPGGAISDNGILTIVDSSSLTVGTNNNRMIQFTHDLAQDGVANGAILNSGITLYFRARLTPPSTHQETALPDGYAIFGAGRGNLSVRQM